MKLPKFVFKKKNAIIPNRNRILDIFLAAIHLYSNDELPTVHKKVGNGKINGIFKMSVASVGYHVTVHRFTRFSDTFD